MEEEGDDGGWDAVEKFSDTHTSSGRGVTDYSIQRGRWYNTTGICNKTAVSRVELNGFWAELVSRGHKSCARVRRIIDELPK